jgi:hypothetical protein
MSLSNQLRDLLTTHPALENDPRRLEAYLRDAQPAITAKDIRLIVELQKAGCVTQLRREGPNSIPRLTAKLAGETHLMEVAIGIGLRAWADALGIYGNISLKQQPPAPQLSGHNASRTGPVVTNNKTSQPVGIPHQASSVGVHKVRPADVARVSPWHTLLCVLGAMVGFYIGCVLLAPFAFLPIYHYAAIEAIEDAYNYPRARSIAGWGFLSGFVHILIAFIIANWLGWLLDRFWPRFKPNSEFWICAVLYVLSFLTGPGLCLMVDGCLYLLGKKTILFG